MIPVKEKDRTVEGFGLGRSFNYKVESKNIRHIVRMLRDSVYSDKPLAVIREYSTNAVDAHVQGEESGIAGLATRPIKVALPTRINPELKIRDYGLGLSEQEVEDIYVSLGESTKRQSNSFVGSLGFGCKSAFAYGDRFTVSSWNQGRKTVYNNVLDDSVPEGARVDILVCEPCDYSETGIEVSIPVRNEDIDEFRKVALNFFKHWDIYPELTGANNGEVEESLEFKKNSTIFEGEQWKIYPANRYHYGAIGGIALMGNVPYPINWDVVHRKLQSAKLTADQDGVLFDFVRSNHTILKFEIGELEFSVSRESLQYTDYTCEAILKRLKTIFGSVQVIVEKKIADASNIWEAKRLYGTIFGGGSYYMDSGEESPFAGNLNRLEPYFRGKLKWNNIVIDGAEFQNLHEWDQEKGRIEGDRYGYRNTNEDAKPVFCTITNDGSAIRTRKVNSRRGWRYASIAPRNHTVVVINDTGKPYGVMSVCRYMLQGDPKTKDDLKTIWLLTFGNNKVKKEFYKHYNFDSVPVVYASKLMADAKAWMKSNRKVANSGGYTGPLQVRILMRNGDETEHKFADYWQRQVVDLKALKGPVYFVQVESGYRNRDDVLIGVRSVGTCGLTNHLNDLISVTPKNTFEGITKIYGILPRTYKARWFQTALKSGQFVELSGLLNKISASLDPVLVGKAINWKEATDVGYDGYFMPNSVAKSLVKDVVDQNGVFAQFANYLADNLNNTYLIYTNLISLGIKVAKTDWVGKSYKEAMNEVSKRYPLIKLIGKDNLRHNVTARVHTDTVQYINLIDATA